MWTKNITQKFNAEYLRAALDLILFDGSLGRFYPSCRSHHRWLKWFIHFLKYRREWKRATCVKVLSHRRIARRFFFNLSDFKFDIFLYWYHTRISRNDNKLSLWWTSSLSWSIGLKYSRFYTLIPLFFHIGCAHSQFKFEFQMILHSSFVPYIESISGNICVLMMWRLMSSWSGRVASAKVFMPGLWTRKALDRMSYSYSSRHMM